MIDRYAFDEISRQLAALDNWEDRYRYIIDLGQALPRLSDSDRVDANKVHGCVSKVWLVSSSEIRNGQEVMTYRGESDAVIVQGLLAVLVAVYSGQSADEVAKTDAIALFDRLGLREHLTMQRSNGVAAIASRIRQQGVDKTSSH